MLHSFYHKTRNPAYPLDIVDKLQADAIPKVEGWMAKRAGDLSVPERKDYIRAVLCLQSKPAKAPRAPAPEPSPGEQPLLCIPNYLEQESMVRSM